MNTFKFWRFLFFFGLLGVCLASSTCTNDFWQLGQIDFPTSGHDTTAQNMFVKGMLLLDNFWYDFSNEIFHEAQALDPNFTMAYYGEAMTYKIPYTGYEDVPAAQAVLNKITDTMLNTTEEKERAYVESARTLFSSIYSMKEREKNYVDKMKDMWMKWPDDLNIGAAYALSLMILGPTNNTTYRQLVEIVSGILTSILTINPRHPAALNYQLWNLDNPQDFTRTTDLVTTYLDVAPNIPNALQAAARIRYRYGDWFQVLKFGGMAWNLYLGYTLCEGVPVERFYFGGLELAHYANLMMGQYDEAKTQQIIAAMVDTSQLEDYTPLWMTARQIIETQTWTHVALPDLGPINGTGIFYFRQVLARGAQLFTAGLENAQIGDQTSAKQAADTLRELSSSTFENGFPEFFWKKFGIWSSSIEAVLLFKSGNITGAFSLLIPIISDDPAFYPWVPDLPLKPVEELYGELLLLEISKNGSFSDSSIPMRAEFLFRDVLLRWPNRLPSLLGYARAAVVNSDRTAACSGYGLLLVQLADADDNSTWVEANTYVSSYFCNGIHSNVGTHTTPKPSPYTSEVTLDRLSIPPSLIAATMISTVILLLFFTGVVIACHLCTSRDSVTYIN